MIIGIFVFAIIVVVFLKLGSAKSRKIKSYPSVNPIPSDSFSENDPMGLIDQSQKRKHLEDEYHSVLLKHTQNEEKIGTMYTVARELTLATSPQMQQVVDLCIDDIKLAPKVIEYQKKFDALYGSEESSGYYFSTFKRLAIIYEKQKRYEDAISVCKQAISLGATKDGTDGGMIGRMARLMKKENSSSPRIDNDFHDH